MYAQRRTHGGEWMRKTAKPGTTAPELIADALREEIGRGTLSPGQALKQDELAARFGVSRIPVREALRRLEEDGLVTVHANRGAFVTSLDDADLVEIFDVRLLLEPDLARRAALHATPESLDEVEAALLAAERGSQTSDWSRLDSAFHRSLYACAGRERQLTMVMALRGLVQRSHVNEALPAETARWHDDHRRLLAACRSRNGEAAADLVTSHLERARDMVRERLAAIERVPGTGVAYYDEIRWRPAMLDLRPNCECCDRDLPNGDPAARICSFECTFCERCAEGVFAGCCPNCGGDFVPRPTRPEALLDRAPAARQRVIRPHSRGRSASSGESPV